MNNGLVHRLTYPWLLVRALFATVFEHPFQAGFSLVAAFAIWFLVEDVENPRAEAIVPDDTSIPVSAVNVPDGYIVEGLGTVRVRVEARETDLSTLEPGDFEATIDAAGLIAGESASREVKVTARRRGVDVLQAVPPTVNLSLVKAAEKEFPVEVRLTSPLPDGYQLTGEPATDPAFVTVRGRPDLVESVRHVEMDVSLAGIRSETYVREEQLIARTEAGNAVTVELSDERARVTFKIKQTIATRTLIVEPVFAGVPADGFAVAAFQVDPVTVTVSGPPAIIDSLAPTIQTEPVQIGGARQGELSQSRALVRQPNVSLDRPTVVVKVRIEPQLASRTYIVAPSFESIPPALQRAPGNYTITVRLSGPLPQLLSLNAADIRATVSLAGGVAGTTVYPVALAPLPEGLKLESADATLSVTLVPIAP